MRRLLFIVLLACPLALGQGTRPRLPWVAYTDLGSGSTANGVEVYCTDCTKNTDPCSSGGSGAHATRIDGAWVCGSSGSAVYNYDATAADLTLTASHNFVGVDASGGARTVTLPTAVGIEGKEYTVKKTDGSANTVTIEGDGSETIDGELTVIIEFPGTSVTVVSTGAAWLIQE